MHFKVVSIKSDGFNEVAIIHGTEELRWSTGTYSKVKLADPESVFDEINEYLKTLPPQTLDTLFMSYREIKSYMTNAMDLTTVVTFIRDEVEKIYAMIDLFDLRKWLTIHGQLYLPPDLKREISEHHRNKENRTYLLDEYIDLAAFALSTRLVLPIWGEYIDHGGQGFGNDTYKEVDAVSLVGRTQLMSWPQGEGEKQAVAEKLEKYIEVTTEDDAFSLTRIYRGQSSAEVPHWLLCNVFVRRLTIVPISIQTSSHSIVSNIYRYINTKVNPNERRHSDRIKEKKKDGAPDPEERDSYIERYKVRGKISEGDAALLNAYAEEVTTIFHRIDPNADKSLLTLTTEAINRVVNAPLYDHQITLTQWVCAKAYPPLGYYHITKHSTHRLIAVTQALLWHWGYTDIAGLMQVESLTTTDEGIAGINHQTRHPGRINRRDMDELMEAYPHVLPPRGADKNRRAGNIAAEAINTTVKMIMSQNWQYRGPNGLRDHLNLLAGDYIVVPQELKRQVTNLALYLAKINIDTNEHHTHIARG